jgi:hypothetical protein
VALPAIPAVPDPVLPPVIPVKNEVPATPPAKLPPLPTPPSLPPIEPQVPPMMGGVIPIKPSEPKKEAVATPPALPALPQVQPVVPSTAGVPPVPPPQLPETRLPDSVPPVSGLPGASGGATVKPGDMRGGATVLPVVPPPADLAKPTIPAVGLPGGATGTPVDVAKPSAAPKAVTPVQPLPVPTNPAAPTPGDNTMLQLHKAAALAVIGGALLAPASPAKSAPVVPLPASFATGQTGGAQTDDKVDLPTLKKRIDDVDNKLTAIQKDIKTLTELLNGKKDEKGYPLPSDPGVVAQMKSLSDKLTTLQDELTRLKTQTSLRPPTTGGAADPKAGKGTVRIVNEYPVRISIVVNGTSYRVEPTKSLDVEVPAGEFSYQLLESGAASTKSQIKEKETVTLRIK